MRHSPVFLLALASALATAAAAPSSAAMSCATRDECCDLCGADSYRCARGPCSTSFATKGFFSISMPTTDVGFWDVVFAVYGMVPYLVPIALALDILLHVRSWTRVFAFTFIPIVAVINAVILVKSLGSCAECARPCGTCVPSKGMPSGHATNAIGLCLWVLLETVWGVGTRWHARTRALMALGSVVLFVPVPYSRVYLGDHTSLQVAIGSIDGIVFGLIYFALLRFVIAKRLDRASQWLARGRFGVAVANDFGLTQAPLQQCTRDDETEATEASPQHRHAQEQQDEQVYVHAPATPL